MKILYGVQGTGNGHISRALAMAAAFTQYPDIEVTWLLSSRPREQGFGSITRFEWRKGISFVARNGKIDVLKTLRNADISQFRQDVKQLNLGKYDLVISDYEPVISHAAKKYGIPITGIGHQYAFWHNIPRRGSNPFINTLMRQYAPATIPVGLHWHHFDNPILPPIVDMQETPAPSEVIHNQYLVYLPFENPQQILELLRPLTDFEFHIYHPEMHDADHGHLHLRAISRTAFKQTLRSSAGVITNAGFELVSECLQWQKSILVKPLMGQMEQLSNAAALEQLGYGTVLKTLAPAAIHAWLKNGSSKVTLHYPDVAAALTAWIATGQQQSIEELSTRLWQQSSQGNHGMTSSMAAA